MSDKIYISVVSFIKYFMCHKINYRVLSILLRVEGSLSLKQSSILKKYDDRAVFSFRNYNTRTKLSFN